MNVSVVICTWNRSPLLDRTLERMADLRVPAETEWELLVVNNACTDDTDGVLRRHEPRLPLRRLYEPRPGKARACNRAVDAACGELILWTDDDVLVDPQWLSAYVEAARVWPEATYFGGAVEPWFETEPPAWIAANMGRLAMAYAVYPAVDSSREMGECEAPYGANMATRREVFDAFRFDVRLGPTGLDQVRGEETSLVRALRRLGHVGVRVGDARVRHFIPRERLTARYIWDYFAGHGRTCVRAGNSLDGPRVCGVPRWMIRQYVTGRATALVRRWSRRGDWVVPYTEAAVAWGMMAEARRTPSNVAATVAGVVPAGQGGI